MPHPNTVNRTRVVLLFALFGGLLVIIVARLAFLMLIWSDENLAKASNQWIRERSVSAQRGDIVDCNGELLASSASCDSISITLSSLYSRGDVNFVADKLGEILNIDRDALYRKIEVNKEKSEMQLARQLTPEQSAAVQEYLAQSADKNSENYRKFSGVSLIDDTIRYYPLGSTLCQVLGFTDVDGNGLEGLEARYNKYLAGTAGYIKTEKDGRGRELVSDLSFQEYVAPKDGYILELTIDTTVQGFAEEAAQACITEQQAESVEIIVMRPKDASILAMVTLPSYDNNNPPRQDIKKLTALSKNLCITDAFEPGSSFGILTLASALETGEVNENSVFNCPGYRIVDGQRIKCWTHSSYGNQSLGNAVANSCNSAFIDMALAMGVETFYDKLYSFGLGTTTGINLYGESSGAITASKYIRSTDLSRIGFGQSIYVTPLQLITAVSATINGGDLYKPRIVRAIKKEDNQAIQVFNAEIVRKGVVSETTSRKVRMLLTGVVDSGSGRGASVEGYSVGGTTGTAQVYTDEGTILQGSYVSSFIGFAPADDPELLLLLVVKHPHGNTKFGSITAAPYAKDIIRKVLKYWGIEQDRKTDNEAERVSVPSVINMAPELAQARLSDYGLNVLDQGYGNVVITQFPAAGEIVEKGSTVIIAMENVGNEDDTNTVYMPNLLGLTAREAKAKLDEMGLKMRIKGGGGTVIAQYPEVNTPVVAGSTVIVEFPHSQNPAPLPSPSPGLT
ncbi:MAG: penicillin-binding transpeptidase domain-containing protein [Christensenellales bacterium]|jgi:stage V sporulation protein D (sporulation-specific penicillin-binding protein)